MHNPEYYYQTQITSLEQKLKKVQQQLLRSSLLRFCIFIATALGAYYISGTYFKTAIIIFGIILFVVFIRRHTKLSYQKRILNAKIAINTIEIDVIHHKYNTLDTGEEYKNPNHEFSHDIDLFGKGSFFQYLNRTTTNEGKNYLAYLLTENNITNIQHKQQTLQELSEKIAWRQNYSAIGTLIDTTQDSKATNNWIYNYTQQYTNFNSIITYIFPIISLALISLIGFKLLNFTILIIWFFIGLGIAAIKFSKNQELYNNVGKAKKNFNQYACLIYEIENEQFNTQTLKEKQQLLRFENKKASTILREFHKNLDALDQRNNIFVALIGNGLFLWDLRNSLKTEKWILKYQHTIEKWFDVISYIDAHNSLANFVYNHPNYSFPETKKHQKVIEAKELAHPLLQPNHRVTNNFDINSEEFYILTGANMAGKSTFLRAISISIVMANCGLPVCAKTFVYKPIKLITSMRTSDSLSDNTSYFHSELKRLKFIVNTIENDRYFVVLDEILKGTNSKDKAIGSKKFVEKLNKSTSTGIIATHDISLCSLADEYNTIKNFYFEAEIKNNELYFDYTLKKGICKNMNASFLLEKMEII